MELLRPRPLCAVVDCAEVDGISLEEALRELGREGEVLRIYRGVYAHRYDYRRISPSMINDLEFCPRLLWVQARLGLKLMTEGSLVALVRGRVLHGRYERALAAYDNVEVEYRVEVSDMVGVVDAVLERGGRAVPLEVKTGVASRRAHRVQLQIYMWLLGADHGYLVYRDSVERVEPDRSAVEVLERIRATLRGGKPEGCGRCRFKPFCQWVR